jgi:hypothetical protein
MNRHYTMSRLMALAASVGATCAIAALGGAGVASAAVKCIGLKEGFASGSSLQTKAQELSWLKLEKGLADSWGFEPEAGKFPNSNCEGGPPKITYTGTSSGAGLGEFGNTDGILNAEQDPTNIAKGTIETKGKLKLDMYVGTDDPPNLGNLNEASTASGDKNHNFEEITIPVAQAPVASLVSLPATCVIPGKGELKLSARLLSEMWRGTAGTNAEGEVEPKQEPKEKEENYDPGAIRATKAPSPVYAKATWGALLVADGYEAASTGVGSEVEAAEKAEAEAGTAAEKFEKAAAQITVGHFWDKGGCTSGITLKVRSSFSGTSYAFKNYLSLATADLFITKAKHFDTEDIWTSYISDGPSWISEVSTNGKSKGKEQPNVKGSQLAEATESQPGSAGYANTADAALLAAPKTPYTKEATVSEAEGSAAHQILYALMQTNVGKTTEEKEAAKYSDPVKSSEAGKETGSCQTAELVGTDRNTPYSVKDSWYGIGSSDPNIAEDASGTPGAYPICALTYDLAWHHYNVPNLWEGETAKEVARTVKDLMSYITTKAGQEAVNSHYYDGIPSAVKWSAFIAAEIAEIEPK